MTGSHADPLEASLQRVVWSLRPYLADVIIVGGWVPYLYRAYGGFPSWGTRLSRTAEVDVLVPTQAPPAGRAGIGELLTSAGFVASHGGSVWERNTTTGERIELLVGNMGTQASEGTRRPIDG